MISKNVLKLFIAMELVCVFFLLLTMPAGCLSPGGDGVSLNPSMSNDQAIEQTAGGTATGDENIQGFLAGNRLEVSGISAGVFLMIWTEWRSRRVATKKIKEAK